LELRPGNHECDLKTLSRTKQFFADGVHPDQTEQVDQKQPYQLRLAPQGRGLGFAGGPVNNYPTHAIARMVEVLRADPGSFGCTTALGWYLTKHSCGVWSTTPPASGFRRVDGARTQAALDALPRRDVAGLVDEPVTIEATAVAVERDGAPSLAIVAARTHDGRRVLANCPDAAIMRSMTEEPWEGRTVRVANDGTVNTIRP
jgi:acetyl-CoA C-acetyltransferase